MATFKETIRSYFRISMQHVHYQQIHLNDNHEDEEEIETLNSFLTEQISLTFCNLTKVVTIDNVYNDNDSNFSSRTTTTERVLLDNISGTVHPGEILAIMGASGSGKTTLLDTLTNRSTLGVTGEIFLNNQLYNHSEMKQKITYVVQDDEFFESLTIREQLIFMARLKLPWHLAEKHVQLLAKKLYLQKYINSPIYLLSHGEKKRLSIATQLLTNSSILVLDEPTSGLDSTLATSLVQLLRNLANEQRKTIILSIHQPTSQIFQTFDQVMLLSEGKIVFMDKPQAAVPYFTSLGYQCPVHFNPADYMMDIISTSDNSTMDRLVEEYIKFTASSEQKIDEPFQIEEESLILHSTDNLYKHDFFLQFTVLYSRSLKLIIQEQIAPSYLIYVLFATLITGVCWFRGPLRESTLEDRASYIMFVVMLWSFEVVMWTLVKFSTERKLIHKEQQDGGVYCLSAYFLGKSLAEIPVISVLPFIYFTITYWIYNLNPYFINYLGFLFVQLLVIINSHAFSIIVGSTIHDETQALLIVLILMQAMTLFGSFYIKNIPSWISWVKYLSFISYAYDACVQISFSNNLYFQCDNGIFMTELCNGNSSYRTTFSGHDVLAQYYKIRSDRILSLKTNLGALFMLIILLEVLAFLALKFVKEKNRRQ